MNTLMYLLEVSVCWGVLYLFYLAVLHDQSSFQYNRFYLLSALCLGWLLPLLNIPVGVGASPIAGGASQWYYLLDPAVSATSEAPTETAWQWYHPLAVVYGLGVVLVASLYLRQFVRLYRVVQQGSEQAVPHSRYRLIYTQGTFPTASFFRYLFWDNTQRLSVAEIHQMMAHEETHILQKHSYDVLYLMLLKIVFWFHPLVYLYHRSLTEVHEFVADAGVVRRGVGKTNGYVRLLSKNALNLSHSSLVNHFFYPSQTLKRIAMIHTQNKPICWYRYALIVPIISSLFFTFACQPSQDELEQEAIVQSYEEVQAALKAVDDEHNAIIEKYYPARKDFTEAINQYIEQHPGEQPFSEGGRDATQGNMDFLATGVIAEKASSRDLERFKILIERRNALREKLTSFPDPDGIYMMVDNQPTPPDGLESFYRYIAQRLEYPTAAKEAEIEGKVFIQFVVDEYGTLTDIKSLKGIGYGCEEEAIRVLEGAPEWNPGTIDGQPVKVKMVIPITFKLDAEG